ncbi:hypothetical protein [Bifidobacterium tibiigranuli]|uniref:Uncharacterized protein n=1 Tax=Bifidobacterium tibiigranuli TaxID=2172043 RepID=A0A5N6S128_9BIFI|nr:hypothetical protein [Bifidobacterium tibiigranuli]KAE8127310.1 hypothetical protein DDF78_08790 [Bifidobacterium tibiigranuli]KAE8129701.1 hypothetical protein DDE84_02570 [Bifidobacterium tibiigranuli]
MSIAIEEAERYASARYFGRAHIERHDGRAEIIQDHPMRSVCRREGYIAGRSAEPTEAEVRAAAIQQYFIELPLHGTVVEVPADFQSGHGLTFYGDRNFLVTTVEFAEELRLKMLTPNNIDAMLVPNRSGTALLTRGDEPRGRHRYGSQSYRRRNASEMLWQMVQSNLHHEGQETGR